jgi:FkbM family methyltransferase
MGVVRNIARWFGDEVWPMARLDELVIIPASLGRYFSKHAVDLVIDCGAFVGDFAIDCRRAGYKGPILSLEPASKQYAELARRAASDPLWTARNFGAGNARQSIELRTFETGQFNSIHRPSGLIDVGTAKTETIELHRLDDVLTNYSGARRIFLKSDTQGNDRAVIEGLGARADDVCALLVEMSVQPVYENVPSHWDMLDFARANGFQPYSFSPVSRDKQGAMIEYDAFFYRAGR